MIRFFQSVAIYLSKHWRALLLGFALAIVLLAIVFAIPLKTTIVERTETYYETEYILQKQEIQEPYTVTEDMTHSKVLIDGYYKVVPRGVTVPINIDIPDARLTGYFENPISGRFAILTIGNKVIWETSGSRKDVDIALARGEYRVLFKEDVMWSEDCYIFLKLEWSSPEEVTRYRTITKEEKVPVQTEKQRIVQEKHRTSLWRYIFRKS